MEFEVPLDDWIAIVASPLPVTEALSWAVTPSCGAVVTFTGTVRDHSLGRPAVRLLEYEAYLEPAIERLGRVAGEARRRWPAIGRLALLHRTGALTVTETAVVVVVSTPNRPDAFDAARFCIDTLKATVPIWKRETWEGGSEWSGVDSADGTIAPGFVLDLHDHPGGHDVGGPALDRDGEPVSTPNSHASTVDRR
jgi:molybdopterin synthase catalytic subunit